MGNKATGMGAKEEKGEGGDGNDNMISALWSGEKQKECWVMMSR